MKQQSFEKQHQHTWDEIEKSLDKPSEQQNSILLTDHYMLLCQHLSLAKQRLYDASLIARLNKLVLRLYRELYRYQKGDRLNPFSFLMHRLPYSIYQHRFFIIASLLMFVVPGLIAGVWVYLDGPAMYSIMDAQDVRQIEQMYDPSARILGRERESDTDIYMFGFYILNNISISFRCFAGGLLAGVGTLLVLFYNGLHIGSVAGYLTQLGFIDTFYPFVIGHGAFELTAIVFSGAAGLRMGYSIISPGSFTRVNALRIAGGQVIPLLYGIILMLVIAAFLEAFWSSSTSIPNAVKYSVGVFLWLLVILYSLSGKRFEPR
jgi:uncharacterized membrane protein SpoIIM required for sporulation